MQTPVNVTEVIHFERLYLNCYLCEDSVEGDVLIAKTEDGDNIILCKHCGYKLTNMLKIEPILTDSLEGKDKLDIFECAKCSLRYKCLTERSEEKR